MTDTHRTPPDGWFHVGAHLEDYVEVELSEECDEDGLPLWERPKKPAEPETTVYIMGYNIYSENLFFVHDDEVTMEYIQNLPIWYDYIIYFELTVVL